MQKTNIGNYIATVNIIRGGHQFSILIYSDIHLIQIVTVHLN